MRGCLTPFFPSRRQFLGLMAASTLAPFQRSQTGAPALFEEVPSSVSGIAWAHENAMSPNRYLPETMGPAVAFVDYDNDGWMDLFIGTATKVDWIEIKWPAPSGRVERLTDVPIDRYVTIVEGQGRIKA